MRILFKYIYILLIIGLSINLTSCSQQKLSYCEAPFPINEITLVPIDIGFGGDTIIIKNDSLVRFIALQICSIDKKETYYSSGGQGLRHNVEIRITPKGFSDGERLFVAFNTLGDSTYVLRQGEFIYFKNDLLCELIARLTNTYVAPKKSIK